MHESIIILTNFQINTLDTEQKNVQYISNLGNFFHCIVNVAIIRVNLTSNNVQMPLS